MMNEAAVKFVKDQQKQGIQSIVLSAKRELVYSPVAWCGPFVAGYLSQLLEFVFEQEYEGEDGDMYRSGKMECLERRLDLELAYGSAKKAKKKVDEEDVGGCELEESR